MTKKETITRLLESKGISTKVIRAIKSGYEGILWNAPVSDFLACKYGPEILLKAYMVQAGTYRTWNEDLAGLGRENAETLRVISKL